MERHEPLSIGDVLRLTFQENDMQARLDELRAINAWPQIVGPAIASQTMKPSVRDGVMTVGIPNASLRHEFMMSRTSLRKTINRRIGKDVITEIRFTSR